MLVGRTLRVPGCLFLVFARGAFASPFYLLQLFHVFPLLLVLLWGVCLFCKSGFAEVESALPFAVEGHPSAKSHVAREMLRRLKEDVQYFANEVLYAPSCRKLCIGPAQFARCSAFDQPTTAVVRCPVSGLR